MKVRFVLKALREILKSQVRNKEAGISEKVIESKEKNEFKHQ